MAGVVFVAVTQSVPKGVQLIAAGVRDLAFARHGVALLCSPLSKGQSYAGLWARELGRYVPGERMDDTSRARVMRAGQEVRSDVPSIF